MLSASRRTCIGAPANCASCSSLSRVMSRPDGSWSPRCKMIGVSRPTIRAASFLPVWYCSEREPRQAKYGTRQATHAGSITLTRAAFSIQTMGQQLEHLLDDVGHGAGILTLSHSLNSPGLAELVSRLAVDPRA